jgi:UDP-glucose 6-dehydrogenase
MKVSVIGTGYVGLVTGACLAEKGHRVVCVDTEAAKVEAITRGTWASCCSPPPICGRRSSIRT